MSAGAEWFKFFVAHYVADTMHLTTMQHGAYLLLLMHQWQNDVVPDDDAQLAAICKCDPRIWRMTIGPVVLRFFKPAEGGGYKQPRLARERDKVFVGRKAQSAGGKKGAATRWGKNAKLNGVTHGLPHENVNAESREEDKKKGSDPRGSDTTAVVSDGLPHEVDPPPKQPSRPPDKARDALWQQGIPILRDLTGLTDKRARTLLGRLLRDLGDDCAAAFQLLVEAQDSRHADPISWLSAAAGQRRRRQSHHSRVAEQLGVLGLDLPP